MLYLRMLTRRVRNHLSLFCHHTLICGSPAPSVTLMSLFHVFLLQLILVLILYLPLALLPNMSGRYIFRTPRKGFFWFGSSSSNDCTVRYRHVQKFKTPVYTRIYLLGLAATWFITISEAFKMLLPAKNSEESNSRFTAYLLDVTISFLSNLRPRI
jgi:hypothetical protein